MVYQAQSPDDLHFLVRMQEAFDELDCNVTYEQTVDITETQVSVSAVCYESEQDIRLFSRVLELSQKVVPEASSAIWENDGKVHLQLRKANAPSYWPTMIEEGPTEAGQSLYERKIAMWKAMHIKYIEQVEDYMSSTSASAPPTDEL